MTKIKYPIRINKYLYQTGVCSRRMADKLIERGMILINNQKAVLGQKITQQDKVTLTKKGQELTSKYEYYIFNKPIGVVSHNPQKNEISIEDITNRPDLHPIGRLDKASCGLMLLSNDGRIVNQILNPKFKHEREYIVQTNKRVTDSALGRMQKGVRIENYTTLPAKAKRIDDNTFKLTLKEGKKHQIRRMASALGLTVESLKRVSMMHIKLGRLKEGEKRPLTSQERELLLKKVLPQNQR